MNNSTDNTLHAQPISATALLFRIRIALAIVLVRLLLSGLSTLPLQAETRLLA